MAKVDKPPPAKEEDFIFRTSITKPDGTIIFAKQYGIKKAFKIPVSVDNDNKKKAS